MNPDPLYNAVVYIPNIPPGTKLVSLEDGPRCDRIVANVLARFKESQSGDA